MMYHTPLVGKKLIPQANITVNPWLSIWFRPRETIRHLVKHDRTHFVLALAAISGIADTLVTFASQGLTLLMPLPVTLALSASVGLVTGIAFIYVSGAILYWSGRLLGGHANAVDIRCALAWSQLPIICGLTIWIPLVIYSSLIGLETIISQEFNTSSLLQAGFVMLASYCALGIWSFILFLQSYSEVQHLNLLRALGSILLPVVVFYLVAIVVSLI